MVKLSLVNLVLGVAIGSIFSDNLFASHNEDGNSNSNSNSNSKDCSCPERPLLSSSPPSSSSSKTSLEEAAYKYGTDKSKDDHKYTDVYQMLFDNMDIKTLVEIGVAAGQSLQAWNSYLPVAQIYGFDPYMPRKPIKEAMKPYPRVHVHPIDLLDPRMPPEKFGLHNGTVDVIIEDASHQFEQQKELLKSLFRLVRPGGYYIMEDVAAFEDFREIENLDPEVRAILQSNDCMLVDSSLGHRAWDQWLKLVGQKWASSHYHHNSYMIVIRKRSKPLSPVEINFGAVAMQADKVVKE